MCDEIACAYELLGICFELPPENQQSAIFGFAEFVSALALLVIVYTITNVRYRFRVAVTRIPLLLTTFILIGVIGIGTLLTDIWFAQRWPLPVSLNSRPMLQGIFGFTFLSTVMVWMYYAFIKPPIFGENNYKHFVKELYRLIVKGADNELPIVADELSRSIKQMIEYSSSVTTEPVTSNTKVTRKNRKKTECAGYAHDMLLLIGNRKFCKHVAISAPATAQYIFEEIVATKKYNLPIGQFAQNISIEAINNKDSNLYHEDEGYYSGLLGYIKPLSKALYGNYELVEALTEKHFSPLDIHYEIVNAWDSKQFDTYARAVSLTLNNYLETGHIRSHSYALAQAFGNLQSRASEISRLSENIPDHTSSEIENRLLTTIHFIRDAMRTIGERDDVPQDAIRDKNKYRGIFNLFARKLVFEIIHSAAYVSSPPDKCWSIHHNMVWSELFSDPVEGKAWDIVQYKARHLLYYEVLQMAKLPNYKGARILAFCLNVMGLTDGKRTKSTRAFCGLRRAILRWTRKNYLYLHSQNPKLAEACLIGGISFDEKNQRLVQTLSAFLGKAPNQYYLELDPSSGKFI